MPPNCDVRGGLDLLLPSPPLPAMLLSRLFTIAAASFSLCASLSPVKKLKYEFVDYLRKIGDLFFFLSFLLGLDPIMRGVVVHS